MNARSWRENIFCIVCSAHKRLGRITTFVVRSRAPPRRTLLPKSKPIVIVANRLPVQRVGDRFVESAGGLVTALVPTLKARGGAWVGWPGVPTPLRRFRFENFRVQPVHISEAEEDGFYNQFSNRTLWPLYHDAIRTPEFDHSWWRPYVVVNHRYAKAAAAVAPRNGLVWVHDYHLQLVPAMLRGMRPDVRIGFFLHVPFPPEELFAWLPWRERILEGLLGADVVGFQTQASARNFSRAAREYNLAEGTDTELAVGRRKVRVGTFPISIDFQWFADAASKPESLREASLLKRRLGASRKILLSVDRLDYTKGIDLRLLAFEAMLKRKRVRVSECVFIQIASPSREPVHEYAQMRVRIEQLVGRINGEFSEPGRVAVHYFRRGYTREQLAAYYRAADVMIVTPLRDGMNLVAKEFVATRSDYSGVLVLSEFAGAARELRQATIVNPRNIEGMADAFETALNTSKRDARHRMAILRTIVRRHDVFEWADNFLEALAG